MGEDMITSSANKKVKQVILWQTKAKERKKDGVFLVEGFKMFEEAPDSRILEVYLTPEALAKIQDNKPLLGKLGKCVYETVAEDVFAKMADTQTPQGVLCVLRRPIYELKDMLKVENPLLVVLENLQDPGNLGTILRTGEGAGVTGVILSRQTVDIYNPKTIRATMGSIYRVPFVYVDSLAETLRRLHSSGIHTYAAHLAGKEYYDNFSFREGTAFLIGNEGNGLTQETADLAQQYLKIPMEGKVESLNAAVATALLMYEAHRQRSL